jgi:hypothetical protein
MASIRLGSLWTQNFIAIPMARVKTCFMYSSESELHEGKIFIGSLSETTVWASLGRLVE